MKAEELTVGDWLLPLPPDGPTQIKSIIDEGGDIVLSGEGVERLELQCWQPIPITPEILDHINFRKIEKPSDGVHSKDVYWFWEFRGNVIRQTIELRKCNIWQLDVVFTGRCFYRPIKYSGTVEYIHELQHIMRDCGVMKEIRLL